MENWQRSAAGLVITLVAVPAFLGLMACLPVPISDPEKSRIDPELTGIWHWPDEESLVLIEPFDKRAWLVSAIPFSHDDTACSLDPDEPEPEADFDRFMEVLGEHGDSCLEADGEVWLYKAWITSLGGKRFMIWVPKGIWSESGSFDPFIWLTFLLDRPSADEFTLVFVDPAYFEDVEGFEELMENVEKEVASDARQVRRVARDVRRVMRRNIGDPDLYLDPDEPSTFKRIPVESLDDVQDIVNDVLEEW